MTMQQSHVTYSYQCGSFSLFWATLSILDSKCVYLGTPTMIQVNSEDSHPSHLSSPELDLKVERYLPTFLPYLRNHFLGGKGLICKSFAAGSNPDLPKLTIHPPEGKLRLVHGPIALPMETALVWASCLALNSSLNCS